MEVGQLIINAGFISAAAYIPLQVYTLIKWEGRWRWLALVPLVVILPVIAWTMVGFAQEKNLWPLLLIFASPLASLYLVSLMVLSGVHSRGGTATAGPPRLVSK
jgi:hypothetical protein